MGDAPSQPDTTELVKQLLERLAISSARDDQAAAISTLTAQSLEARKAIQDLKGAFDKATVQHNRFLDQNDVQFKEIQKQLEDRNLLNQKIAELTREKEELRATVK